LRCSIWQCGGYGNHNLEREALLWSRPSGSNVASVYIDPRRLDRSDPYLASAGEHTVSPRIPGRASESEWCRSDHFVQRFRRRIGIIYSNDWFDKPYVLKHHASP
jgi:hypothetical protein